MRQELHGACVASSSYTTTSFSPRVVRALMVNTVFACVHATVVEASNIKEFRASHVVMYRPWITSRLPPQAQGGHQVENEKLHVLFG